EWPASATAESAPAVAFTTDPAAPGGVSELRRPVGWHWPRVALRPHSGEVLVESQPPWKPFTPVADGKPLLRGPSAIERAACRRPPLAALFRDPYGRRPLRAFRGPDGVPLVSCAVVPAHQGLIALSEDGRLLAFPRDGTRAQVRDVTRGGAAPC